MTLVSLTPSVIYPDLIDDDPPPTAHVPIEWLPSRALCGHPVGNESVDADETTTEFVRCPACLEQWERQS